LMCVSGRRSHCFNRTTLGIFGKQGVFAEYITLPEENLKIIPDTLSSTVAVFTEPLAAALEIFEKIHIRPTDSVFIFGVGKLGALIAQVFRINGCNYTAFDRDNSKIRRLKEIGLNCRHISELPENARAEVCVDCTGAPTGLATVMQHLYPCGKLVLKTTVATPAQVDLNSIVINEFEVIGSRCGPFAPAVKLLAQNLIDTQSLITRIYKFGQILEAFQTAVAPDSFKIVIEH